MYDNNEIWAKKLESLVFGKVYENYPKIKEKCYFTKLTSKRAISTGNHFFGPKIITKFGQKKWVSLALGKVYKNCLQIKEKFFFRKHTSKRIISTRNHLFDTIIRS